jgi:hypothetical protein
MSDRDEPELELTPEQEAQVRRLLAGARHTAPMPGDVVARLDRVLAGLGADQAREATVVRLADRRRKATRWLVAAAAVVVVGVGVDQVVNSQGEAETSSGLSAETADQGADAGAGSGQSKNGAEAAESGDEPAAAPKATKGDATLVELGRRDIADGLTRLRHLAAVGREPLTDGAYQTGPRSAERAAGAACGVAGWGRGRFLPVSYAGAPAVVVLRRPVGETQVADVFLCGSEQPVRSVTLPAP